MRTCRRCCCTASRGAPSVRHKVTKVSLVNDMDTNWKKVHKEASWQLISRTRFLVDDKEKLYQAWKGDPIVVKETKEMLERTMGTGMTVILGGSQEKGTMTTVSDADLMVSFPTKEDAVRAGNVLMKEHHLPEPIKFQPDGALLFKQQVKGRTIDILLTWDTNKVRNKWNVEKELQWFTDLHKKYANINKLIVLLKMWSDEANLGFRGSALETLAADACEKVFNHEAAVLNDANLQKVLLYCFKKLAGSQPSVRHKVTKVSLVNDMGWKKVHKEASWQIKAA
eukprot:TRINITY_DN161_c0_g2_i3.p1 TRINITY_DN161_c0_g2~~TRINITY_DN161_c0_g2_i3.p1  ORF type:complete len:282 (+),score=81.53 TRINITY_DN161_c0_g2_i3:680-1525(+)